MVKFISGIAQKIDYQIERKSVFWQVNFDLPTGVRERMGIADLRTLCGCFIMGFYCDPLPGDTITYRGHEWCVIKRQFTPSRYRSKDKKLVPTLLVEYLGEAPVTEEEV